MKVEVQNYHKSIYSIGLPKEQEAAIWDFYVTHAIASSASQRRSVADYSLTALPWKAMKETAGFESHNVKILLANSINNTLLMYDLETTEKVKDKKQNKAIEIDIPKLVCLTPFTISDENPPKERVGEAESVLTHIRNSFAHGLTYFFDNNNVLFEDKNSKGTITARMILKTQTLIDWIALIDQNQKYYTIHQVKGEE